jgi:small-conductance mechanosensitive channel
VGRRRGRALSRCFPDDRGDWRAGADEFGRSYAVYFGTAVLILASLGFNPLPFLAGAGILGLVVGFGAQSLINDVVSGFFILFENTYLVGDVIEAGSGKGVVEAIEFRTTKIRDVDGRVHIIRNGDVKDVINYSKDYTLAVVPVDVVYDADLRWVFSILKEAGERLRAENPDVLEDTAIDGITAVRCDDHDGAHVHTCQAGSSRSGRRRASILDQGAVRSSRHQFVTPWHRAGRIRRRQHARSPRSSGKHRERARPLRRPTPR